MDHDQGEFTEERSTILTLKDADVLDNEEGKGGVVELHLSWPIYNGDVDLVCSLRSL